MWTSRMHSFYRVPHNQRSLTPSCELTVTLLVSSYFDAGLGPNPNLKRDFPHITWHEEITVLFVGKRKPFVKRAPPDLVVRSAIAQ